MTDEREQPTQIGDDPNPSRPGFGDAESTAVYAMLVRKNELVDEDSLNQAIEIATADRRGILDVLVERGSITPAMRGILVAMASELASSDQSHDFASDATIPPTDPVETTDDETLSPDVDQETATIKPSATPGITSTGKSILSSSDSFGDYEIIEEIARGGMGVVYKARQISLNRVVALKKVLSGQLADEDDIKRFRIEAEASANLDHPGIVPVYDFGEVEGQHYFSMGFVEGRSLADRINESPLESRDAAELLVKIARAVAYANEKGVIHRDLKPGNVLLDQAGEPRVTDFGLAKQQADDSGMTATGQILGTPSYMPPEQASGKADKVDQRADVYALGAILYTCLTGRPPFQAANPMETLILVLEKEPVSVRQLVPGAPRDLETICLKCLHKDAGRRYESGNEFANDLLRWLVGEPIVARRVSRVERTWKWCRRKPLLVGAVTTIVTLLVFGSAVFWERQNAAHADGLVNSLVTADAPDLPDLLDEIDDYRWWTSHRLRDRLAAAEAGSKEELHLALALLPEDPYQTDTLMQQLLQATPSQVHLIRAGLADHSSADVAQSLWKRVNNNDATALSRTNAACFLAAIDSDKTRWADIQDEVALQLVDSLARSPRDYVALVSMLEPVRIPLSEALGKVFRDPTLTSLQQETALNVLVEYAVDQPSVLCDVSMDADADTFERLFPLVELLSAEAVPLFAAEIARSLEECDDPQEKERIGQRQANAAIALMRLSQTQVVWPMLGRRRDPRAGSWFIARADEYSVPAEILMSGLDLNASGDEALMIQMSLLQALGQFDEERLARAKRVDLIPQLLDVYRDHPDPGLHGAVAWLLRRWGQSESLQAADAEMQQRTDPASESRGWYVNSQGQTMVIVHAGEFMMGTAPDTDPQAHYDQELYHMRRINRTIALAATEVTKAQFREFESEVRPITNLVNNPRVGRTVRTEDSAMSGMTWYEAVQYCNWLNEREGIPEDQWCYEPNTAGQYGQGTRVKENFWELSGYRLPTEAEWEYACRAGSVSRRFFGYSDALLSQYTKSKIDGEGRTWPVGMSQPNAFGLFDMYGNVYDWCQDDLDVPYADVNRVEEGGKLVAIVDTPEWGPVSDAASRATRGGSFLDVSRLLRSANRMGQTPGSRLLSCGFRVARTYRISQ